MPAWKEFEVLALKIQSDLAPDAAVTIDESLVGRSGVRHQCDVVMRAKAGQYDFVCILECKDHAEKVGLEIVRGFLGRLEDLEVKQGVLVSAAGFTEDALKFARANGIITYTLVDAQSVKWSEQALLPLLLTYIELGSSLVHFRSVATREIVLLEQVAGELPLTTVPLLEDKSQRLVTLGQFITERWDEILPTKLPSESDEFAEPAGKYVILSPTHGKIPVEVTYRLTPRFRYHYNWFPLRKGRGFLDHTTQTLLTADEYESGVLNFREAVKTWPFVERREDLPIKPLEQFFMARYYYRTDRSGPDAIVFGRERVR